MPGKGGDISVPLSPDIIPSFVRGGSILPLQERPRRSSVAMHVRPWVAATAAAARRLLLLVTGRRLTLMWGAHALVHALLSTDSRCNAPAQGSAEALVQYGNATTGQ